MTIIVFEDIDGSSKTSLIEALEQQLTFQNIIYHHYQGLGSSSIGPQIRDLFLNFPKVDCLARFYLSLANMAPIQEELIAFQLKNNLLIILDRWLSSTYAYQLFPYLPKENYAFQQLFNIPIKI